MKVLILTACYNRPGSFKMFLENFKFLTLTCDVELYLLIVGNEENREIAEEYSVMYVTQPNKPVGRKWNIGCELSKEIEWDYLFISGADDIYSPALFNYYAKNCEDYHYLGLLDFYFYDLLTNRLKYFPGFKFNNKGDSLGAGRLLHRSLVESLNFELWDEINSGLDGSMTKRLDHVVGIKKKFINLRELGLVAIDIKDGENIHGFDKWKGTMIHGSNKEQIFKAVGL